MARVIGSALTTSVVRRASSLLTLSLAVLAAGPLMAQQYEYVAELASARPAGEVIAGNLRWRCEGRQCRISGPWPQPAVGACRTLAAQVGQIVRYGRVGAELGQADITACNATAAAPQPSANTPVVTAPISRPVPAQSTPRSEVAPAPGRADTAEAQRRRAAFEQLAQQRERQASVAAAAARQGLDPRPAGNTARNVLRDQRAPARLQTRPVVHSQGTDCDDTRADRHPAAAEQCNGYDDNCDGLVDENVTLRFYLDTDGDGHGDPTRWIDACPSDQTRASRDGAWLVLVGNDCDDRDPSRWRDCN